MVDFVWYSSETAQDGAVPPCNFSVEKYGAEGGCVGQATKQPVPRAGRVLG